MKVGIYSRSAIEMLLKTGFPKNIAVISFYDPPGKFHDENYCAVDYKGKPVRLFQVAVHDIDLSVLPEYGLNYNTYFTEACDLAEFIFEAYQDGLDIICQCEYGESRSSGCAAAILEYFYQDGLSIFTDYRYYPNQVIYHKVFDALNEMKRKKQNKEKESVSNENKFLIHSHYGIRENFSSKKMIFEATRRSYRDFWRRIHFRGKTTFSERTEYERRSEYYLSEHLPMLFQVETQEMFDEKHYELCESLIGLYDDIGGIPYGVAQRLVNQTMIHLIIIESNLQTGYWNIAEIRKYFHVPVELHTLQMATTKGQDDYQHVLHLKCAPYRKNKNDYEMDWFGPDPGKVIPFEQWNYPEYIEYQTTLRKALENSSYADPVDWWFQAFAEIADTVFVGVKV